MSSNASEFATWAQALGGDDSYSRWWKSIAPAIESSPRAAVTRAGESVKGEPLWAVSIEPTEEERNAIFIIAGLHAIEHVGCDVAFAIIDRATAVDRWRNTRVVVMPAVNVDGIREVCVDRQAGRRKFRRTNANRVDLNRNFAKHFRDKTLPGMRRFFNPGRAALSEPETTAVDRVFNEVKPAVAVSLHAFGRYVYLPWAGTRDQPERAGELEAIASHMVAAQPGPRYKIVQLARRSRLFRAYGTEIDHFHHGGALALLFEIGPGPLAKPGAWFDPFRWYTPGGEAQAAEIANVVAAIESLADFSPLVGTNPS